MTTSDVLPLVAVVVPVYDAGAFVAASLCSVAQQSHGRWFCVVVDDGSTDDSWAQITRATVGDPRFLALRQDNRGVSEARNAGLRELPAETRYVSFLDADDLLLPDALDRLVDALEDQPAAVGAYGLAELVDEHGRTDGACRHGARQRDRRALRGRRLVPVGAREPLTFNEAAVVSPVWPPAVALFRRSALDAVGGFDRGLVQLEDWDLYLRLLRLGDVLALDEQVAWYRTHGGQATGRVGENVYFSDQVRRRAWRSPANTAVHRTTVRRAWRQVHVRRSARVVQRLARAVARGDVRRALPLAVAALVMGVQTMAPGPPPASRRLVRWSGRTV
ncbi:MAG: glycosyltransferase family 2 protein [Klenkia sp.]|nr:glycosyltransferase family 2 protein [Klenkia sp.]